MDVESLINRLMELPKWARVMVTDDSGESVPLSRVEEAGGDAVLVGEGVLVFDYGDPVEGVDAT